MHPNGQVLLNRRIGGTTLLGAILERKITLTFELGLDGKTTLTLFGRVDHDDSIFIVSTHDILFHMFYLNQILFYYLVL